MSRQDDLIEANKRGLLTGQTKVDFDMAVSRGLISQGDEQQPIPEQPLNEPTPPKLTGPEQTQKQIGIDFQGITNDILKNYSDGNFSERKVKLVDELKKRGAFDAPEFNTKRPSAGIVGGISEVMATIGTGAISEPIAGLAGIVGGIIPGEEGQSKEFVEKTKEALTYIPKSEEGLDYLSELGELAEPIGNIFKSIETGLGDYAFNATGSPAIAAAAATIPTAIAEALGLGAGKKALSGIKELNRLRKKGKIAGMITEAIPTSKKLKDVARSIYKEIDDTGATIDAESLTGLIENINKETKKLGIDKDITPNSTKALNRFKEVDGKEITVTELDTLRKVAKNAAKPGDPAESLISGKIVSEVDSFLEKADETIFKDIDGMDGMGVGEKYKVAQDLWGRAKRSEMLQDAFENARNQASGFENGIRVQFRQILNNKNKSKFFNKSELDSMKKVVRGDTKENIARLVGKLGFNEGSATNLIGASVGAGIGAYVAGPVGAVTVPLIGQVSRKLAQRMTIKNAEFADEVIRAGKNAKKITEAYLNNTGPAQRSAAELSELLMRQDIDLNKLPNISLAKEARDIVMNNRLGLAGSLAPKSLKADE